jgi:hypothetical protein
MINFLLENPDLTFVYSIIILLFYIPFGFLLIILEYKKILNYKRFYRAVITVLERNPDDNKCVPEIFMAYKKLIEYSPRIKKAHRSAVDSMEDFLYKVDSTIPQKFKNTYELEVSQEVRKRMNNIILLMRQSEPFASISNKYSNLMNMLKNALNTGNKDLGTSMLDQLADDVEIMEHTIYAQQRVNSMSIMVSIIGVILTIIFGIISIVPLLNL